MKGVVVLILLSGLTILELGACGYAASADAVEAPTTGCGSWVGQYTFEEFAPPNLAWTYKILISPKGNALAAQLNIDGFQVGRSIICDALIDGQKLLIKFVSYGEDDIRYTDDLAPGQILLTLERMADESLLTHWGAFSAQLEENQVNGKVYFLAATGDSPEGTSPFSGAWYGEAEDSFLAFDLTIQGDQVTGTHACGDNEGISIESPDESDIATTVTGKVTGDKATIQIKVGYERDRTVTGTLTSRDGSLLWEMAKNAPDFTANTGITRTPTTFFSVAPGPGNWVCFWNHTSAR